MTVSHDEMRALARTIDNPNLLTYIDQAENAKYLDTVPPGWALVPITPTAEMIDAGDDTGLGWIDNKANTAEVYGAMIALAGEPPALKLPVDTNSIRQAIIILRQSIEHGPDNQPDLIKVADKLQAALRGNGETEVRMDWCCTSFETCQRPCVVRGRWQAADVMVPILRELRTEIAKRTCTSNHVTPLTVLQRWRDTIAPMMIGDQGQ